MFFTPEDDDEFVPSFGGGKSKLSSLFGADQAALNSGNESLTYTAPKQPKKPPAGAAQEAPPAVIHAVAAQAFKFVNGQHASQGKLGVAVLGNHAKKEYRLLLYVSKKQQVTSAKITSTFSFVVQANNYSSFYDDARHSWSLRFDSQQNVIDFAKQIGLAKYNAAPGSLVKQDLQPGEGQAIDSGDVIEVKYTGSLWTNNTFGKVFDSNAAADKLFKLRPGKGKVIKGWEDGVLGMKKGGKRLLVIPPELAYGDKGVPSRVPPKATLLFEVEISRVKFSKEKADNVSVSSNDTLTPSAAEQTRKDYSNMLTSSSQSRDEDDMRERTASLTKDISSSPEKGSEKAKLLARMSKMGKNVLKLPGAVPADPEVEEPAGRVQDVPASAVERPAAEQVRERPRTQSQEYHESTGNPHPHSPSKPPIAPRSAHVNRIAHSGHIHEPNHVTQPPGPPQYHHEYQSIPPMHIQGPPPQQTLALYQSPLQQAPPVFQQPAQYGFPQPQFQPVLQPPPQPIFQPAPAVQSSPQPVASSSGGTSDAMMPLLMSESRQHQTEVRQAISKVSEKIDGLQSKIELIKQSGGENSGAITPAASGLSHEKILEASILMNSIVKLVQENERMKKENVEKTSKIENLNEKISELLHRSQRYVEQSNIFLEQRNESLQQTTSYSQSKLVQLEREKATLSTELGTYKQSFATLETELEILRKQDGESREQLKKTSSQMQKNRTELVAAKESLTEKEEEIQKLSSAVKSLRQERKKMEGNLTSLEESVSDLKQEKESLEKNLTERKKKHQEMKKRMDEEMEELKAAHEEELHSLKERHRRELTSSSSSLSQQISELEMEMETKWQEKSKHMVNQNEKKWQRKYDDLVEECDVLKKKVSEGDEKNTTMKNSQSQHLQEIADLQEQVKDLEETRDKYASIKNSHGEQVREMEELRQRVKEMENVQRKYQDLRTKSIEMKGKYERRIEEVMKEKESALKEAQVKFSKEKEEAALQQQAAVPSRDKVVEEVKQIMNKVFFKIREEFVASDSYKGSAVISVVLRVIKTMTLKLTSGVGDEESEEEEESEEGEEKETGEDAEDATEEEEESEEEVEEEKNQVVESQVERKVEGISQENEGNAADLARTGLQDNQIVEERVGEDEVKEEETVAKDHETKPIGSNDVEDGDEEEEDVESNGKATVDVPDDRNEDENINNPETSEETEATSKHEDALPNDGKGTEENEDINRNPVVDTSGDGVSAAQVSQNLRDRCNFEEDLEKLSNISVHGSELDPEILSEVASEDGHERNTVAHNELGRDHNGLDEERPNESVADNDEQDKVQSGNLVSDLPSMDELAAGVTSKENVDTVDDVVNEGPPEDNDDTREDEVSKKDLETREEDNDIEKSSRQTMKSEADADTAGEEKAAGAKKIDSLSALLSDSEDDVQGLFDAPPPRKNTTPAKGKVPSAVKSIPPPLFDDDDDDDDLDWFS